MTEFQPNGPMPDLDRERLELLSTRLNKATGLVELPAYGMGYHTRIKGGTKVHPTRESMELCWLMALRGDSGDYTRICDIIRAVVALQGTDPDTAYCGIWPWFAEEPLERMNPPDWNWADFIGAYFVDILAFGSHALDDETAQILSQSLALACEAIIKRDVGPHYTNICAMGAAVTICAGELLGRKDYLDYGRERLEKLDDHMAGYAVFDEYNSPAYTPILILELDRILRISKDRRSRKAASRLHRIAWEGVAQHFHPATMEWAGPHARCYWDVLGEQQRHFLRIKTGLGGSSLDAQPCPEALRDRFHEKQPDNKTLTSNAPGGTKLTTWLSQTVALGSVNDDQLWTQRRPLIAHLSEGDGKPVSVFRLRVLLNGRDFASARLESAQAGPRVLGLLSVRPGHGIWHLSIDRPEDARIPVQDLRIRFELQADGAEATLPGGASPGCLMSGNQRIEIHSLSDQWLGLPLSWEIGKAKGDHTPAEQDRNWFPTNDDQGADATRGIWIDAVCQLPDNFALSLDSGVAPDFAFGVSFKQNKRYRPTDTLPLFQSDQGKNPSCRWEHDANLASLHLKHRAPETKLQRSISDSYWLAHPILFFDALLTRLSARSVRLRRCIASGRRCLP